MSDMMNVESQEYHGRMIKFCPFPSSFFSIAIAQERKGRTKLAEEESCSAVQCRFIKVTEVLGRKRQAFVLVLVQAK